MGAGLVALAVPGRRVVDLEEELEQVAVGDPLGVEDDLDRLGVIPRVCLCRVFARPAGVADAGGVHPVAAAQQLLDAPEAASRKDRGLGVVSHRVVPPPESDGL